MKSTDNPLSNPALSTVSTTETTAVIAPSVQSTPRDFIRAIISEDLRNGKHARIVTRFPPEPNGYLHIGHAKSICLNFGVALEHQGVCALRFDDTNPTKESVEYVEAIQRDVRWLGYDWHDRLFYASDYFPQLYQYAVKLIQLGKAYVCSLSPEQIRAYRGTLTEPGRDSPYRNRSIAENLDLFERMKAGEFPDGTHVLRAKIDMCSPNINMRDPVIYRILHATHHRTQDTWCIYPMYDFTHCLSDAIEGVTHSLCTLEFEDHRPLYDWFLETLQTPCHPQQIEFARLAVNYTVTSKRRLNQLVIGGYVDGWDDPRLPTIGGLRRRGYTPAALRDFCDRVGITKKESIIDMSLLETCVREDLDRHSPRVMAVLRPLRVVITNYPDDHVEQLEAPYHPNDATFGSRLLPFSKVIYIERDDFMEDPPKGFFRLSPGHEVRLRYAYIIKCVAVIKNTEGEVVELHCTYDPDTKSGSPQANRKVKGTIHWVSAGHAIQAEVRLYDRLFLKDDPLEDERQTGDFKTSLNPHSMEILYHCQLEPSLAKAAPESHYQFERQGYFCVDWRAAQMNALIFNRTVTLRDSWAKQRERIVQPVTRHETDRCDD